MFNFLKRPDRKMESYAKASKELMEHKTKFADILASYTMGNTTKELLDMFPSKTQEVLEFKDYLDNNHLTIEQAVVIYQYSVNSTEILSVMRNEKTIESLQEDALHHLRTCLGKLYPKRDAYAYADAAFAYANAYDFDEKGELTVQNDFEAVAKELGVNPLLFCEYAHEMMRIYRVKSNIRTLNSVLANHIINEPKVVYRGVNSGFLSKLVNGDWKNLIGKDILNEFPTSTSKSIDQCMSLSSRYNLIFEINIPAGTRGMDIEPMSMFGESEGEILLANNALHITGIDTVELNGIPRILAHADIIQKGYIEEYLNTGQEFGRDYWDGLMESTEIHRDVGDER